MSLQGARRCAAFALAGAAGLGLLAVAGAALTAPRFVDVRASYGSSEARLLDRHGEAALLEQPADGGCGNAFAN